MPFEFIQIPANGQGNATEELNKLLRGGRIASVRKELVANGEDSFQAFCIEFLDGSVGVMDKGRSATTDPRSTTRSCSMRQTLPYSPACES